MLTLLLLGTLFGLGGTTSFIIPLLFCFHVALFAMSFGPVTWIVIAEIFPTKIRGQAMAIGTFTIWISCALVSQTFPWLRDNLGTVSTFFIFAIFFCPSIWLIWCKIPETKQKTLEEIERYWLPKESGL
jgi:SP family arabinose:H+ symporter-like MFS transporter